MVDPSHQIYAEPAWLVGEHDAEAFGDMETCVRECRRYPRTTRPKLCASAAVANQCFNDYEINVFRNGTSVLASFLQVVTYGGQRLQAQEDREP